MGNHPLIAMTTKMNSIYTRVLLSVIFVMLLQTLLISTVLTVNGTLQALDSSATENLHKNAENRGIALESLMVHQLSNLDTLEQEVLTAISYYLDQEQIGIDTLLNTAEYQKSLLQEISQPLIAALRRNSSTGVFFYIINDYSDDIFAKTEHHYQGIYYRDQDPVTTPSNYTDLLFLRGPAEIFRKEQVQLDSLWKEQFTFTKDNAKAWLDLRELLMLYETQPDIQQKELYYWNTPHLLSIDAPDVNELLSYSRLLLYEGKPVAIIGTEMQSDQMVKHFPPTDFGSANKSGYALLAYHANTDAGYHVLAATGSYLKRLLAPLSHLELQATTQSHIYTLSGDASVEPVHLAMQPLKLYNAASPFAGQQWVLASVGADSQLFAASSNLKKGLLYSSGVALLIGGILLSVMVRLSINPLYRIVSQLQKSDPADPILDARSSAYEIALLCTTINAMKERRKDAEMALREERERYLVALENVADTFMEYDPGTDSFMLYYFHGDDCQSAPRSHVIENFLQLTQAGEICHPDDAGSLTSFFREGGRESIELRAACRLFPHLLGEMSDGEYYWFSFKASPVPDESGLIRKIIGIARHITEEKLRQHRALESSRRDITTRLYHLDYGLHLIRESSARLLAKKQRFAICAIRVQGFDLLEARYGRLFAAIILHTLGGELNALLAEGDIGLRACNDSFLLLLAGAERQAASKLTAALRRRTEKLYTGESRELHPTLSMSVALSGSHEDPEVLMGAALAAVYRTARSGAGSLTLATDMSGANAAELDKLRINPPTVSLDIQKSTICAVSFDLFEHTVDIPSAIQLLLGLLGGIFALRQILICTYDADFGASQADYQWNGEGATPFRREVEKIGTEDFTAFQEMLGENGVLLYNGEGAKGWSSGIRTLAGFTSEENSRVFGCAMYENGVYAGTALFKAAEGGEWSEEDMRILHEISKTISARISIEKSNSASRAKSEFLSRISHEIRTPMNAIIGMTKIAKEQHANPERLTDCLETIDLSSRHLLSLINDVLDMSRIESGKLGIENAPFSLSGLLDSLDRLMRPQLEGKGLTLSIQKGIRQDRVTGDEYRLRQVMVNLLGNAGKFTKAGGSVTLSLMELGSGEDGAGHYRFSVKDTGIGISKEDKPKIFKAFEQASNQGSIQRQGTGLGLAISANIIAAMGGTIELQSELGEGSEFYFTLRLEQHKELPQDAGMDNSGAPRLGLQGKRVLLVEDNDINLEIAAYVLMEAGVVVEAARDGKEAVDRFAASDIGYYQLILMDIQMPVMDGLTATRMIRKDRSRSDARTVPIIAMTANAFDDDMKKSIESGMNGHLTKPIEMDKLFATLESCLGQQSGGGA